MNIFSYKNLILGFLIIASAQFAKAVDFTVELTPAANSVGDTQVSSISNSKISGLGPFATASSLSASDIPLLLSSKISDFSSSVLSAISSTLSNYVLKSDIIAPNIIKYIDNTVTTYSPSSGVKYIRVKMVGGGGGGAGSGTSAGSIAGNGGNTTFGTLLTANGGGRGIWNGNGGFGGSASILSPANGTANIGNGGQSFLASNSSISLYASTPLGGSSQFGGVAPGSAYNTAGGAAASNSGSGGNGGGNGGNGVIGVLSGPGGGAGGYIDAIISSPSGTYSIFIGSGGNGGGAGGSGYAGGAGGSGYIEITEYFQ